MKKIALFSGIIFLLLNLVIGLLLSSYDIVNLISSSLVIIITTALLMAVNAIELKDAFRVSLTILFTVIGFTEFLTAIVMPTHVKDNWGIVAIAFILSIQAVVLVSCYIVTRKNNTNGRNH